MDMQCSWEINVITLALGLSRSFYYGLVRFRSVLGLREWSPYFYILNRLYITKWGLHKNMFTCPIWYHTFFFFLSFSVCIFKSLFWIFHRASSGEPFDSNWNTTSANATARSRRRTETNVNTAASTSALQWACPTTVRASQRACDLDYTHSVYGLMIIDL